MSYTETEIKIHIADIGKLARRLEALGATLESPRTHEMNLRFDTPAGTLLAQTHVLRLRRDAQSKLTYKGSTQDKDGVGYREEIEFTVGDYDAAQRFLEALGYVQVATYEKYRTTYELNSLHIMLDEMPFGNFIEIEGENATEILALAEKLSLNRDLAVKMSYLQIFELLRDTGNLDIDGLTFDSLSGRQYDLAKIGIHLSPQ